MYTLYQASILGLQTESAVLMTARPMLDTAMDAIACGVLRYLPKPVATDELVRIVENAVHLRSSSGPLYLALASYYRGAGNLQKANEMESKGRELVKQ